MASSRVLRSPTMDPPSLAAAREKRQPWVAGWPKQVAVGKEVDGRPRRELALPGVDDVSARVDQVRRARQKGRKEDVARGGRAAAEPGALPCSPQGERDEARPDEAVAEASHERSPARRWPKSAAARRKAATFSQGTHGVHVLRLDRVEIIIRPGIPTFRMTHPGSVQRGQDRPAILRAGLDDVLN